ncbi:MAG: hypothetical protein QNJ97_18355 [Myxococcota bacterium]|nr:hypothetical protein [Myxococcota bacterium]
MPFKPKKIKSKLVPLDDISEQMVKEMHTLFLDYYEHSDYETFIQDLGDKTGSFHWRERDTGRLIAFANIKIMALPYKGRKVHVFFCGDTVCHRSYWQRNASGNSPMAPTVFAFLLRFLLRHPFSAYWFMLSMSFRTYLVIANNLVNYYPHYQRNDRKTQKLKEICHLVADHMYGDKFDSETGLVDFGLGDKNQTIKSDVAPVTEEMLRQYPKIAFYEALNPDNQKGIEMASIGALDLDSAVAYFKKFTRRVIKGVEKHKKAENLPGRSLG